MALVGFTAVLAGIGLAEALIASRLVARLARGPAVGPAVRPPMTVLKPLHGDEPLLEQALTTLCRQDYPVFQVVFGVQDATDPAVATVRRLQARFPDVDIALVIDPTLHGRNRKVANLINMMAAARHDVLVIADADVHVRSDYLDRLVTSLQQQGVGLVTTLYAGLPARSSTDGVPTLPARLGAMHITQGFLPAAVLARALGRQDCLGATMCLRRRDLEAIGGLHALVDHLADDNVLGRRIAAIGQRVALADTVVLTTVAESSLRALFRHELRWARTIRTLEPAGFAASVIRYPLAWALLTVVLAGGAVWAIGTFLIAWVLRAIATIVVDGALARVWSENWAAVAWPPAADRSDEAAALVFACPVWLLPLRDLVSVAVMLASYASRRVDWRGHRLYADTPPRLVPRGPLEGTNSR